MDQRFPKEHRLRRKREFDRVFDEGAKARSAHFMVIAAPGVGLGHHRIGIIVSAKVGNAVKRNLLKRRIREFYRTKKKSVEMNGKPLGADFVIVTRPGAAELDYDGICEELEGCWRRL